MARHLPTDSATFRAINPDWEWDVHAQLLALVVDEIRVGTYTARALGGDRSARLPDPLPRPGVGTSDDVTTWGRDSALPLDEMADWLGPQFVALITD